LLRYSFEPAEAEKAAEAEKEAPKTVLAKK
jgi:hypothetical protein